MDINSQLKGIDLQKNNLNIDKGDVIITYNRYRSFFLPLLVIFASVLVLLFIVIPQINQYFASRQEVDAQSQKLSILKDNYNFLTNLDQANLDKQLKLLVKILPTTKDFFGIMNSVSAASSKAGLSIESYSFSPGNLSKVTDSTNLQYPSVQMQLKTIGDMHLVVSFIDELYKTAPLAQILSIKNSDNKTTMMLEFNFKPFPPQNISDETPVSQMSADDTKFISKLFQWNNVDLDESTMSAMFIASSSAEFSSNSSTSSAIFSPF